MGVQIPVVVIFTYFLLAVVLIKFCHRGRGYWMSDSQYILRTYLTKLSLFYIFLTGQCFLIYYVLYKRAEYTETSCFYVWSYHWTLIGFMAFSIFVTTLRYMAFGLASSDTFNNRGIDMPNPRAGSEFQQGWSIEGSGYKSVIGLFYTMAAMITGMLLVFLYFYLDEDKKHWLNRLSVCTPALQDNIWDGLLFSFSLIVVSNSSSILAEFLLRKRSSNPEEEIFGASMNTPFVTTTVATTWLSWFPVLFYLHHYVDASAGQYVLMLAFTIIVEGSWCILTTALASVTRKPIN